MQTFSRRMRKDWNRRARSDAKYYVALGCPAQSWQQFFDGAVDLVGGFELELERLPERTANDSRRALEIGCGPGRLMAPLSRHFDEIHGVDVSNEMVLLARKNLASISHAHVHEGDGVSLTTFDSEFFDFVYSYAVFQHIPSREIVSNYLVETKRVLKTGGIARLHFSGLPEASGRYDTWSGVRLGADEIKAFALDLDLQLLALEGAGTQYMWSTLRKRSPGWREASRSDDDLRVTTILRCVTNSDSSAPVVPVRGRFAAFSLWIEGLPATADLNTLQILVGSCPATLCFIGPLRRDGAQQVNALLPEGLSTGLQPVRMIWMGDDHLRRAFLRVVPPPPEVPHVVSVSDGVCVAAGSTISSSAIRIVVEEVRRVEDFRVQVDGQPARTITCHCVVPRIPRHQITVRLPAGIGSGLKRLECWLGPRFVGAAQITVARDRFWWLRRLHPVDLYQAIRRGRWR